MEANISNGIGISQTSSFAEIKFDKTVSLKQLLKLKDNAQTGFALEVDL